MFSFEARVFESCINTAVGRFHKTLNLRLFSWRATSDLQSQLLYHQSSIKNWNSFTMVCNIKDFEWIAETEKWVKSI